MIQEINGADRLAVYRLQVSEEVKVRAKMSDPALAKLRALKEQERIEAIGGERFRNALQSVIVNPANLRALIERCNTSIRPVQIEQRVQRLNWWIDAGYLLGREIDTVTLINFFSSLTPGEDLSGWTEKEAKKRRESRRARGVANDGEPVYRPCKSGKKCLRFEKRKPAPAKGSGEYCGPACAASNKARQKRSLAALPSGSMVQ
jgi:hypothetical protein